MLERQIAGKRHNRTGKVNINNALSPSWCTRGKSWHSQATYQPNRAHKQLTHTLATLSESNHRARVYAWIAPLFLVHVSISRTSLFIQLCSLEATVRHSNRTTTTMKRIGCEHGAVYPLYIGYIIRLCADGLRQLLQLSSKHPVPSRTALMYIMIVIWGICSNCVRARACPSSFDVHRCVCVCVCAIRALACILLK